MLNEHVERKVNTLLALFGFIMWVGALTFLMSNISL